MKYFVLIIVLVSNSVFGQNFTIERSSFGTILINGQYQGSAFVAGTEKTVITCSHVIGNSKEIFYQDMDLGLIHPLKVIYNDTLRDFAILLSENPITKKPLEFLKPDISHLGSKILYFGYDIRKSDQSTRSYTYDEAVITTLGSTFNAFKGASIDFIDYEGVGINGFSGGPVFDIFSKKVIGIISERYVLIDSKNQERNFNRAFSISPVMKLFDGR